MAVHKDDIKMALLTGVAIGFASLIIRVYNRKLKEAK